MRYRTRSQEVEAIQYTGTNSVEVRNFCSAASAHCRGDGYEWIEFVDRYGVRRAAHPGQYIVKHDDGFSLNVSDGFERFWEPVPDLVRTVEDYSRLPIQTILVITEVADKESGFEVGELLYSFGEMLDFALAGVVCRVVELGGDGR